MNKRLGRLALLLLVVVNVSALLTFAYNRWVREPVGRTAPTDNFKRELCLSGPQERCIKDFRFAFDSETRDFQARIRQKKLALVEELKKASPDGPTLDTLINEISGLQAEIQKKAVEDLLKEKEVLTDEQKATFFRLFEDHVCPRASDAGGSPTAGRLDCPQSLVR